MKKKIQQCKSLILLTFLAVFLLFNVESNKVTADIFSDIEITRFDATLVFDNDGDMHVTETWYMNYLEYYRVRFRDIEYDKFPTDYPLPYSEDNVALFNTTDHNIQVMRGATDYTAEVRAGYSFNNDYDERFEKVACPYESTSSCESIFIDFQSIGGLKDNIQITYDYIIEDVVTEYSDVSEINWVLFEYAESGVNKGTIDIQLPSNLNNIEDIDLYTPLIRNSEVIVNTNDNITINFENMKHTDQLGFRLLIPTNTFSSIQSKNIFINEDMNRQVIVDFEEQLAFENQVSGILVYVLSLISIATAVYYGFLISKQNKTLFGPHKTLASEQTITAIPTEHKPAIVGYLYNKQVTSDRDISATLLDLISRGYLIIDDSKVFNDPGYSLDDLVRGEKEHIGEFKNGTTALNNFEPVTFNRTYRKLEDDFDMDLVLNKEKSLDDLETYEMHLIDWYINGIGDGEKVSTKAMTNTNDVTESRIFLGEAAKFRKYVKESCEEITYYDDITSIQTQAKKGYFLLILLLIITVASSVIFKTEVLIPVFIYFLTIIVYFIFVNTRKRKSYFIQDFHERWTKYRKNLKTLEVLKTANISDVEFWDNNLVYATVFGIAEEVLIQLKSVYMDNEEDEIKEEIYLQPTRNYYYRLYRHRLLRNFHNKVYTNANHNLGTATSSHGRSGFGGGFSGGGSFGGGGGGGRSR